MFVSIKKNKYQFIISTIIGSLIYFTTRDETLAFAVTLFAVVLLRFIKIDKILNKN